MDKRWTRTDHPIPQIQAIHTTHIPSTSEPCHSQLLLVGVLIVLSVFWILIQYHTVVTKVLPRMPAIRTYVKKDMMTREFVEKIQDLPTMKSLISTMARHCGRTKI